MKRALAVFLATVVAHGCGATSTAPVIANRADPTASCVDAPPPFALAEPIGDDPDCAHGPAVAAVTASAAAPTCYRFRAHGSTGAIEAVTVDGHRVWIEQSGCVHASFRVVTVPTPGVVSDRVSALRAAGALLIALGPLSPGMPFADFGVELTNAAPRAPANPISLGAGDWTAMVDVASGRLEITVDFPL